MVWNVKFTQRATRQALELDKRILPILELLIDNLRVYGPFPGKHWPNYGKLHNRKVEDKRHCHLKKGSPTYVCCWEVKKHERSIEVYYVGTHEKAPY